MKTIATIVIGATLIFSAVVVVIFLTRDRQPHSAPAQVSASDSPAPPNSPPPAIKQDNYPAQLPPNLLAKRDPPSEKASTAMGETVVKNFIAGVRIAAAKGDDATRKMLLNGLRKDAPTARRLLQNEISSATDSQTKTILEEILKDIQ